MKFFRQIALTLSQVPISHQNLAIYAYSVLKRSQVAR
jgi:hypothetical protein